MIEGLFFPYVGVTITKCSVDDKACLPALDVRAQERILTKDPPKGGTSLLSPGRYEGT